MFNVGDKVWVMREKEYSGTITHIYDEDPYSDYRHKYCVSFKLNDSDPFECSCNAWESTLRKRS